MPATNLPFSGYVRVSRVGGRSGESYRSPSDQREIIESLARKNGLTLDEIVAEEDVSGSTPIEERELGRLIRKVKTGESGGLIVWKITRYSRDFVDGILAAEQIRKAGGRVISDEIDTSSKGSRVYLAMLLDFAEEELQNRKATWKRATEGAIERGLHIGRVPLGYVRPVVGHHPGTAKPIHGPLILDPDHPEHVEAVKYVFRERAVGATWGRLRADLEERWGMKLSRSSVYQITTSRTYLGEVRHGDAVKHNAHPALVSEAQWQAAQDAAGERPNRNGLIRNQGVLHGRVYCGGCGGVCYTGTTGRGGAAYGCANKRKARCPAPASITVERLDGYVIPLALDRIDTSWDGQAHAALEVAAGERLAVANRELVDFLEFASASDLGEHYTSEVAKRRQAIQAAQADLYDLMSLANQAGMVELPSGAIVPIDPRNPRIWAALPITKRREIAATVVDRVVITKGGRGSRRPVGERAEIIWKAGER